MPFGNIHRSFPISDKAVPLPFLADNIARAFAADILNRLTGTNQEIPEFTEEEWAACKGEKDLPPQYCDKCKVDIMIDFIAFGA